MSTMNEERDKVPNDIPVSAATERARSEERGGARLKISGSSRRSRSEGPPGSNAPGFRVRYGGRGRARTRAVFRSDSDEGSRLEHTNGPTSAAFRNAVSKISTEYRLQFAWPREGEERLTNGKPLASSTIPEAGLGPPRKSISMGTIKQNQSNIAPVHRKRNTEADKKDGQSEAEPLVTDNRNEDLRGYKTEYKKKFRPFSHYDYVGGRFLQKEASNEHKNEVAVPPDSMWYKEVLELRKKADEYKHRGWGADMLAEGESDTRLELWQQVLCRSSLSALSLASTTPRPGAKDEKTAKKVWPGRAAWSRNTTPHQRDKSVSQHKDERSQSRVRSAKLNIRSTGGRSKSVDPGISETKSPKRTPRSPVPQAGTKTAKTSSEARPRPTTLTTTAPSRPKTSPSIKKSKDDIKLKNSASTTAKSVGQSVAKKGDTSKKDAGLEQKEDEEPTSLIDEPIVKSPPEPTRVKSPEQMMIRSPEPVNWTVPLDTGKTFTVTQNVQGEALARLQGESIPASTTPQVHSQVSSGNSLSLESLEVCKIMDLSFTNENLENHFEPVNVSSPVSRELDDQTVGNEDGNLSQTDGVVERSVADEVEESKESLSLLRNPDEHLSDFEKFNNVHMETNELDQSFNTSHNSNENLEANVDNSLEKSPGTSSSFNDSGFEKEEERQQESFSEPAWLEKGSIDEISNEKLEEEKIESNSNGNISEGYVSVDKAGFEMNDSFISSNDADDDRSDQETLNKTNDSDVKFDSHFPRKDSEVSEIENQSIGKYSIDEETDTSLKSDIIGHYDNLEHESIFTKEDLMSDKNNSSLDGSELYYPLSSRIISEKLESVDHLESQFFQNNDTNDVSDEKDSDSVGSVVEAVSAPSFIGGSEKNEETIHQENEIVKSSIPDSGKSVKDEVLSHSDEKDTLPSSDDNLSILQSSDSIIKEVTTEVSITNKGASDDNFLEDVGKEDMDDKNQVISNNFITEDISQENSTNSPSPSPDLNSHHHPVESKISSDNFITDEKTDDIEARYAVVSTTDFEESSININESASSPEINGFIDSVSDSSTDVNFISHLEQNDFEVSTVHVKSDRAQSDRLESILDPEIRDTVGINNQYNVIESVLTDDHSLADKTIESVLTDDHSLADKTPNPFMNNEMETVLTNDHSLGDETPNSFMNDVPVLRSQISESESVYEHTVDIDTAKFLNGHDSSNFYPDEVSLQTELNNSNEYQLGKTSSDVFSDGDPSESSSNVETIDYSIDHADVLSVEKESSKTPNPLMKIQEVELAKQEETLSSPDEENSVLEHFSNSDFASIKELSIEGTKMNEEVKGEGETVEEFTNEAKAASIGEIPNQIFKDDGKNGSELNVSKADNVDSTRELLNTTFTFDNANGVTSSEKNDPSAFTYANFANETQIMNGAKKYDEVDDQPSSVQNFFSGFKSMHPTSDHLSGMHSILPNLNATELETARNNGNHPF